MSGQSTPKWRRQRLWSEVCLDEARAEGAGGRLDQALQRDDSQGGGSGDKRTITCPVSMKTTFNAVTHALISTQLTDKSGGKLGSAIQIIDKLDTVKGEVPGASGDKQFRIYVQLKTGCVGHAGQEPAVSASGRQHSLPQGIPALLSRQACSHPPSRYRRPRDQMRADIDVDYRSSGFPKGLVNGHLSAANSDVRAGRNDEIHNNQWLGLNNWWRGLLSFPRADESQSAGFAETGRCRQNRAPEPT